MENRNETAALPPEEIGQRASAILRSVEGLLATDAAAILSFAHGMLPKRSADDDVVRFPTRTGGQ